ncbi:MAG: AAA family ATPase [Thermosphaera sp.]
MPNPGLQVLLEKIARFRSELEKPFVGRSEEAMVLTLGLITGEHVILIGEPGTAKSALARRAAELINARFFKYLLTRFTEPDELFGPLDINELRNGRYVRITKGKLPEAEIAFIDEVFNANSAILNMLLSIMNERIVYDGYSEIKVPLWTMISATNRVPDEVELQALYDRFLLRHFVKPVEENKWGALLDAVWTIESGLYPHGEPVLTIEDLVKINGLVYQVDISSVKEKLIKLYGIFEDQGIHVTDRRKGKALKIIAANALLRQSMKATQDDLFALRYVVPRDVEEVEKTYVILLDEIEAREKHLKELSEIEANVREAKIYISNTPELDPRLLDYLRSFETVKEKVRRMAAESSDDEVKRRAIDVLSEVSEVIDLIKKKLVM